ncbi:hypothetical protein C0989_004794 [Termitomyces sp. Mn162]|nr:hypothetical protein C0989_004794 [Termitomyces sp. Mn162]
MLPRVLSGVEEEWGKLGGSMNVVVVLELSIGEEFILVILALIAEEMEVLLLQLQKNPGAQIPAWRSSLPRHLQLYDYPAFKEAVALPVGTFHGGTAGRAPSLPTPALFRDAPVSSSVQCGQTDSSPKGPYPGAMSATPATSSGGQQQQGVQGGGNPE